MSSIFALHRTRTLAGLLWLCKSESKQIWIDWWADWWIQHLWGCGKLSALLLAAQTVFYSLKPVICVVCDSGLGQGTARLLPMAMCTICSSAGTQLALWAPFLCEICVLDWTWAVSATQELVLLLCCLILHSPCTAYLYPACRLCCSAGCLRAGQKLRQPTCSPYSLLLNGTQWRCWLEGRMWHEEGQKP